MSIHSVMIILGYARSVTISENRDSKSDIIWSLLNYSFISAYTEAVITCSYFPLSLNLEISSFKTLYSLIHDKTQDIRLGRPVTLITRARMLQKRTNKECCLRVVFHKGLYWGRHYFFFHVNDYKCFIMLQAFYILS